MRSSRSKRIACDDLKRVVVGSFISIFASALLSTNQNLYQGKVAASVSFYDLLFCFSMLT